MRFARDVSDAALCLCNLAERHYDCALIAIFDHRLEIGSSVGRIPELLDQPGFVRNASGNGAAFAAPCALCNRGSNPSHV